MHRSSSPLSRVLITGATVVTMDPNLGTIDEADVLIDNRKILAVGKELKEWAVTRIDGRGMIALPGFVNGHLHLWQPAIRAISANWSLDQYFGHLIGDVVKLYQPEDAYIGNLIGALDQLDAGVTTLFDWCHIVNSPAHADAAVDGLEEAGIRAIFGYGTPMWLFGTRESHPVDAQRMRTERLANDEARLTMALAIRGTDFAPGTAEADIRFARKLGVTASFHIACAKHGPRPQNLVDLAGQQLLGRDVNLVHANFLEPDEFRAAADCGVSIAITPEVEMQMGLGLPPTGAALAAGARVTIGTDVVTSVGSDMFTQMRFLLQTQRALTNKTFHDNESMPEQLHLKVDDVLRMATLGGAECFGLDQRTGSLTPGKQADLILLRGSDINLAAIRDPVSAIVLHANVANIELVMVGGEIMKRGGKLVYPQLAPRLEQLQASSDRIYAQLRDKLN